MCLRRFQCSAFVQLRSLAFLGEFWECDILGKCGVLMIYDEKDKDSVSGRIFFAILSSMSLFIPVNGGISEVSERKIS